MERMKKKEGGRKKKYADQGKSGHLEDFFNFVKHKSPAMPFQVRPTIKMSSAYLLLFFQSLRKIAV